MHPPDEVVLTPVPQKNDASFIRPPSDTEAFVLPILCICVGVE